MELQEWAVVVAMAVSLGTLALQLRKVNQDAAVEAARRWAEKMARFERQVRECEDREKVLKAELNILKQDRDDLRVKVRTLEEVIAGFTPRPKSGIRAGDRLVRELDDAD